MRKNIEFKTDDGVTLLGWHYLPDTGSGPFPTIVMAHGFSATKELFLDKYAELYCAAGMAVLVYDHRNLGASDGQPRQEIDPWAQINGYRDAITFAETLAETDASRIGIFGSSYSGGHVLVVAALDRRVKCVVAQVPLVDGPRNAQRIVPAHAMAGMRAMFEADRRARYAGQPPIRLPVVSNDGTPCALPTTDSYDFMVDVGSQKTDTWINEVTLRSVEMFMEYKPGAYISQISPTPLLMLVQLGDHLTVADLALEAYEKALQPKKLITMPGGHFAAYIDNFETAGPGSRDWFAEHLR
ncbi:MAG: alpha/beta hydrolase [Nevskia sp.]|uniref:alpha/beta hydrolase n=1 Tax=Nevskia sp. TaxID=1929292 RepID=UPI00403531EF